MDYKNLFIAILVLAFVDTPWLAFNTYVLKDPFYHGGGQLRLWAALVVYLALAYLLLNAKSAKDAFWTGVTVYAVYDFTLLAVFSKFSLTTAAADTLWGGILFYLSYMGVKFIQSEMF
jgi:uncharacterized membrane protein